MKWMMIGLLTGSCGTLARPTYVQPSERAFAVTPTGEKAAIYDVGTLAAVKVWSNGIDEGEVDGEPRTLVHVGLELANTGDGVVDVRTQDFRLDYGQVQAKLAVRPAVLELPKAGVRRVDEYFELPPGVQPQDVRGFAFHWALENQGHDYEQTTVFVKDPSLVVTPFVTRWNPPIVQHRHKKVVIGDGVVVHS